jgi:hypothetical protein
MRLVTTLLATVSCTSATKKTLFLHDTTNTSSLAAFFNDYDVSSISNDRATLKSLDTYLFDTIILSDASGEKFPIDEPYSPRYMSLEQEAVASATTAQRRMTGGLSIKRVLEFFDEGRGNVLMFVSSLTHESLIAEFGINLERKNKANVTQYPVYCPGIIFKPNEQNTIITLPLHELRVAPQTKNTLVFPVVGDRVACIQARNGARACVVVGSIETFPQFSELLQWVQGKKMFVEYSELRHKKVGGNALSESAKYPKNGMYTAEDELEVEVDVRSPGEFRASDGTEPVVMIEMTTMADAYYRVAMRRVGKVEGGFIRYSGKFRLPDRAGVYKLIAKVEAGEPGWGGPKPGAEDLLTIRAFRHDDYSRFLIAGMPWYSTVFLSLAGTGLFALAMTQELAKKKTE